MRQSYSGTTKDQNGRIITSATVSVYLTGTTTATSIYSSATSTTAVNSVTSSSTNGTFTFYVDRFDYDRDQAFDIIVSKTGYSSVTYSNISIENTYLATYTIAADKSISTNLGEIPKGVIYSVSTGITLTLSKFSAGNYKIFTGSGTVSLGDTSSDVYAEWFGFSTSETATNNASYLQKALTAASGKVLRFFSSGTAQINNTSTVAGNNTTILGNNDSFKIQQMAADKRIFYAASLSGLKFQNLYLYGKGDEYSSAWTGEQDDKGIDLHECTSCEISNNLFQDFPYAAVHVYSSNDILVSDNIIEGTGLIEANISSGNNQQFGVNVIGDNCLDVVITGNDISYACQGIFTASGYSGTNAINVTGNNIHDIQGQHGIYGGGSNLVVSGNAIHGIALDGIKIQAGEDIISNISVTGNVINNATDGILLDCTLAGSSMTGVTVTGNAINTVSSRGISLNGTNGLTTYISVNGNTVMNTTGHGIYFDDAGTDYNILGNIIKSSGENGIYLEATGTPSRVKIGNNIITNVGTAAGGAATQCGIMINNVTGADIFNNLLTDTNGTSKMINGMYFVDGSGVRVFGNKITNSLTYDVRIDDSNIIDEWSNNDFSTLATKYNGSRLIRHPLSPIRWTLQTTADAEVTIYQFRLEPDSAYLITGDIVGKVTGSAQRAAYRESLLVYRDGTGDATQEGSTDTDVSIVSAGFGTATHTWSVSGTDVLMQMNSKAATTYDWSVKINYEKVVA